MGIILTLPLQVCLYLSYIKLSILIYLKKSKKNINNFNKLLSLNPSLELLSSFMCVRTTVVIATKAHPQNKPFLWVHLALITFRLYVLDNRCYFTLAFPGPWTSYFNWLLLILWRAGITTVASSNFKYILNCFKYRQCFEIVYF